MGITIPVGANLTLRPSVEWVLRGQVRFQGQGPTKYPNFGNS